MIQVFSKRKDKPVQYGFVDLGGTPSPNEVDYPTVEFSTSPDGINWTSAYDVKNMEKVHCYSSPNVPVAKKTNQTKKIGFQDGERIVSTSFDSRELKFKLVYKGVSQADAMLAFEAAQRFLVSREAYWITFADWLGRMYYGTAVMGDPEFSVNDWTCEVTFTDLMGLSRSIGTSLSPVDDEWGVNNNVPNNGDYPPYTFKENKFSVYNLSDIYIDPERQGHQLKIVVKGAAGDNFQIKNLTTGDYIKRPKGFSGTWELDGVNPTLNNEGDLLNITGTHGGVITLNNGKNDFQVDNFSGEISFDFPFWRLS